MTRGLVFAPVGLASWESTLQSASGVVINNLNWDILPKGVGQEWDRVPCYSRCLLLKLTDHNTGITRLFSTSM